MNLEQWQQIELVLDAALDAPRTQWPRLLDDVCAGDPELRSIAEALLDAYENHDDRLERIRQAVSSPIEDSSGSGHAEHFQVPTTVSHYEIISELGRGGMGRVFKGYDRRLNRFVALKLLTQHSGSSKDVRKRFINEARAASALDHPNVCIVFDIGEIPSDAKNLGGGQTFIAMAYYEGESLKEKIAREPIPLATAINYAIQIAEGLSAAHKKGIVHRDIKPANVLVTADDILKIVDFGLAIIEAEERSATGLTMGTVSYMSPEQIRGEEIDHRTDIWSLGVVLYEMLTGQKPFKGEHEQAVIFSILNEPYNPVADLTSWTPPAMDRLMSTMLAKDKEARYSDTETVSRELRQLMAAAGEVVEDRAPTPAFRRVPRKRYVATIVSILIALIAIVLVHKNTESLGFQERDWVLITEFENHTGDPVYSGAIEEALTKSLRASKYVNVVPGSRVFDALALMKRPPNTRVDPLVGREIAVHDGNVQLILGGSIRTLGESLILRIDLIDAVDGSIRSSFAEEAHDPASILEAIELLSDRVRRQVGESSRSIAETQPIPEGLERVTTSELQALTYYRLGYDYVNQWDWSKAAPFFEQAVMLDSTFALAHVMLGWCRYNPGSSLEAQGHFEQALNLSDSVSERERLFIEGSYHLGMGHHLQAAKVLSVFTTLYPDDYWGRVNLADAYASTGDFQQAISQVRAQVRLRPNHPQTHLTQFWYELAFAGDLQAAQRTRQRILELSPMFDFPDIQTYPAIRLWLHDSLDASKISFDEYVERSESRNPLSTLILQFRVADFSFYHGQFLEGIQAWDEALNAAVDAPQHWQASSQLWRSLGRWALGDTALFVQDSTPLLTDAPHLVKSAAAGWLAIHYATTNQMERMDFLIQEVADSALDPEVRDAFTHLARGSLSLARGETDAAIERLEQAVSAYPDFFFFKLTGPQFFPLFAYTKLAEAYEKAGHLDEAIETLEALRRQKIQVLLNSFGTGTILSTYALFDLGRLYDELDNSEEAEARFQEFVDRWGDADRPIAAVSHAQARLRSLKTSATEVD